MGIGNHKYSVLMSVYMCDDYKRLRLAIQSMLNQTVEPEQFVIVVDGPVTEDISKVIDAFVLQNPGLFEIVVQEKNQGLANALNIGLKYCRNDLVARMDADDISLPRRCEKELLIFDQYNNLAICGCQLAEFYSSLDEVGKLRKVPCEYDEIKKFMHRRQAFNHPTVMYRKTSVIKAGGYPKLRRKEDFDLFSRMLTDGCFARNIPDILYMYHVDKENDKRRKSWVNFRSALWVYRQHYKRRGCTLWDFVVICVAELFFLVMPCRVTKFITDNFLRSANNLNRENSK